MENSNKSIAMAEKRVGEMNKLTQGFLEQSNRYFQQRNQPQTSPRQNKQFRSPPTSAPMQEIPKQNVPNRNNLAQNFMPNTQEQPRRNVPLQNNVPFRNNMNASNAAQKPRFEAVGSSRRQNSQPSSSPPRPEPFKPQPTPSIQNKNQQESFLPISLNSDTALIAALAAVLVREKADTKLILALLYILY